MSIRKGKKRKNKPFFSSFKIKPYQYLPCISKHILHKIYIIPVDSFRRRNSKPSAISSLPGLPGSKKAGRAPCLSSVGLCQTWGKRCSPRDLRSTCKSARASGLVLAMVWGLALWTAQSDEKHDSHITPRLTTNSPQGSFSSANGLPYPWA